MSGSGLGQREEWDVVRAWRPDGVSGLVSGGGDQGADPNKLVAITDHLAATTIPAESFRTVMPAGSGQVLRGVSFTPGTETGGP